jgi:hypothetical protein
MSNMNFGLRNLLVRSLIDWSDRNIAIHSIDSDTVTIEPVINDTTGLFKYDFPVWETSTHRINDLGLRLNEGHDLIDYEGRSMCYALLTTREGREADRAGEFDLQWVEQAVMTMACDDLGDVNHD